MLTSGGKTLGAFPMFLDLLDTLVLVTCNCADIFLNSSNLLAVSTPQGYSSWCNLQLGCHIADWHSGPNLLPKVTSRCEIASRLTINTINTMIAISVWKGKKKGVLKLLWLLLMSLVSDESDWFHPFLPEPDFLP